MDVRRYHKKSRTGCVRCKQRRIKCDEQKPSCKNCLKHEVQCSLRLLKPVVPLIRPLRPCTTQNATRTLLSDHNLPCPHERFGITLPLSPPTSTHTPQTLELLHHYQTALYASLGENCPPVVWNDTVPRLSFTHPFILPTILAMSSLHLASLVPTRRSHLQLLSFHYEALALPTFRHLMSLLPVSPRLPYEDPESGQFDVKASGRQTLPEIPTPNIHALFACASHVAYYVLAAPSPPGVEKYRLPSKRDEHPHWWQSMRGFMALLNGHWLELADGPMGPSISRGMIPDVLDLESVDDEHLVRLDDMLSSASLEEDADLAVEVRTVKVLRRALLHLRHIFAFTHLPYSSARFAGRAWPGIVSQAYTELLYKREPRALVIMACYCVLLKRMDDLWYMFGLGAGMLNNIVKELGGRGGRWEEWLQWVVSEPVKISGTE